MYWPSSIIINNVQSNQELGLKYIRVGNGNLYKGYTKVKEAKNTYVICDETTVKLIRSSWYIIVLYYIRYCKVSIEITDIYVFSIKYVYSSVLGIKYTIYE